jgi:Flp pilus assembly protein TadB
MNVIYVLLLGQPVPGWWWQLVGPIQNVLALPIVAFAFVIKVGSAMSLIAPLIVVLVLLAIGLVLFWLGLRMVRKKRSAKP